MNSPHSWPTVESEIHRPASWFAAAIGLLFLSIGIIGIFAAGSLPAADVPAWLLRSGAALFAILGAVPLITVIKEKTSPARVIHAAPEALPDVPTEPLILEGSVVYGRMTHELVADDRGWQLHPCLSWHKSKRTFLGFAIPFMILFAGALSWIFNAQMKMANWPAAIVGASVITLLVGGATFGLIGSAIKASYSRLCTLSIPNDGDDLQLERTEMPNFEGSNLAAGLRWALLESTKRQLTIPRESVIAVQLCPWKYVVGRPSDTTTTWAVQGLLVLSNANDPTICRIPILLTSDFAAAAKTTQRLAEVLEVPYLFSADATGWKNEIARAKSRPPLRVGGTQS
jgi:hypothetical protein